MYAFAVVLFSVLSVFSYAQSLSIATIDSLTIANSSYPHEVKAHITLGNDAADATFDMARIYNGSVGIADSNYFCWDLCYGVGHDSSEFGGVFIPNGGRNSDFYVGWYIKDNNATATDSVIFRCYNAADNSDYIDLVFKLSVSPTISILESKAVSVEAYPNPASDRINVQVGNLNRGTIRLMDLTGKQVVVSNFNKSNGPVNVSVRELPAGVYMLQVVNEGQILNTQRIVVSH